MAIVKLGVTVVGIRGTVGGGTYSANLAGPYLKSWSKPPNPRTSFQTNERSILSRVSSTWRTLSSAQRTAWDGWAAAPPQAKTNSLGLTYHCSGFQWYVAINIRLEVMGRPWRTAPPISPRPIAPSINNVVVTVSGAGGSGKVVYPSGEFASHDIVIYIALRSDIGSRVAYPGYYLCAADQAPGATQTWFGVLLRAHFGYTLAGNTYFAHCYRQNSEGGRSAPGSQSGVST